MKIEKPIAVTDTLASRKMTFRENMILTIKLLTGFVVFGLALWGITLLKNAK